MKAFVDTNVLIYSHDESELVKKKQARTLLAKLAMEENGVVSVQVFLEFSSVALTKLHLDANQIRAIIASMEDWECIRPDREMVQDAVFCSKDAKISIWDAMLVVAAERARCDILYTEDLNHGQHIRGIQIINPFV